MAKQNYLNNKYYIIDVDKLQCVKKQSMEQKQRQTMQRKSNKLQNIKKDDEFYDQRRNTKLVWM